MKPVDVVTLQQVHQVIKKWLYMPNLERIDLILAVTLSLFYEGNPLWVFIVGSSGDAKTEIVKALEGLPHVRKIDQLTANTFASGKPDAKDLGSELTNKKTILIFIDLACLTSLNKDEKKKIWSQFRTLYDKEIYKDTGSGAKRKYKNCHVVIIACTTRAIKEEYHIHQQLGTREFLYDTLANPEDNVSKMHRVIDNMGKQHLMRQEIKQVVHSFIKTHRFNNNIPVSKEITDYLYQQSQKLAILRATGPIDWTSGELTGDVDVEVPTRLIEQFTVLYKALKSLDVDYKDKHFKNIVENIIQTSSHPVRYKLYYIFKKQPKVWFTVPELQKITRLGRKAIIAQCETLWNLRSLKKEIREEHIGVTGVYKDEHGNEHPRGGRIEHITYYKAVQKKKTMEADR
jgi:hypothetical protein